MLSSQEQVRLSGAVQAKISLASLNIKDCVWARAASCPPKGKSREGKGAGRVTKSCCCQRAERLQRKLPQLLCLCSQCPLRRAAVSLVCRAVPSFHCHPLSYRAAEPLLRDFCNKQHLPEILFRVNKHLKGFWESVDYFHYFWFKYHEGNVFQIFLIFFQKTRDKSFCSVPWTRVEQRDFKFISLYLLDKHQKISFL